MVAGGNAAVRVQAHMMMGKAVERQVQATNRRAEEHRAENSQHARTRLVLNALVPLVHQQHQGKLDATCAQSHLVPQPAGRWARTWRCGWC